MEMQIPVLVSCFNMNSCPCNDTAFHEAVKTENKNKTKIGCNEKCCYFFLFLLKTLFVGTS